MDAKKFSGKYKYKKKLNTEYENHPNTKLPYTYEGEYWEQNGQVHWRATVRHDDGTMKGHRKGEVKGYLPISLASLANPEAKVRDRVEMDILDAVGVQIEPTDS